MFAGIAPIRILKKYFHQLEIEFRYLDPQCQVSEIFFLIEIKYLQNLFRPKHAFHSMHVISVILLSS